MWILFNQTIQEILINAVIYAILSNIMYSLLVSGKGFKTNVILYVITMELKFLIMFGSEVYGISVMTLYRVITSIIVYTILGLIIVKIQDKMVNYHSRISFVILSIIIGCIIEFLLAGIIFAILDIITLIFIIVLKPIAKAIFN